MQEVLFENLLANGATISLFDVLINIILSIVLGLMITMVYKLTYKGYAYSVSFVNTLVMLTMITTIVIMVIGNNLARAFGLVGAMSIIRFRTAVKDSFDIAFVFFALAAGMAAGSGNHVIGIVGCVSVSLFVMVLHLTKYGSTFHEEMMLRFWSIPVQDEHPQYMDVMNKYLAVHSLVNIRSARLGEFLELTFNVRFRKNSSQQTLVQELSTLEGIERVTLIYGENYTDY